MDRRTPLPGGARRRVLLLTSSAARRRTPLARLTRLRVERRRWEYPLLPLAGRYRCSGPPPH